MPTLTEVLALFTTGIQFILSGITDVFSFVLTNPYFIILFCMGLVGSFIGITKSLRH